MYQKLVQVEWDCKQKFFHLWKNNRKLFVLVIRKRKVFFFFREKAFYIDWKMIDLSSIGVEIPTEISFLQNRI